MYRAKAGASAPNGPVFPSPGEIRSGELVSSEYADVSLVQYWNDARRLATANAPRTGRPIERDIVMKSSKVSALAIALVLVAASGSAMAAHHRPDPSRASISRTAVANMGNRPQHAAPVRSHPAAAKSSVVGNRPQHAVPVRAPAFASQSAADAMQQRDRATEHDSFARGTSQEGG